MIINFYLITVCCTESELIKVPPEQFQCFRVEKDCQLLDFIKSKQLDSQRGCAYYEFGSDPEDIPRGIKIVLKSVVSYCRTQVRIVYYIIILS